MQHSLDKKPSLSSPAELSAYLLGLLEAITSNSDKPLKKLADSMCSGDIETDQNILQFLDIAALMVQNVVDRLETYPGLTNNEATRACKIMALIAWHASRFVHFTTPDLLDAIQGEQP